MRLLRKNWKIKFIASNTVENSDQESISSQEFNILGFVQMVIAK